jgi:hypothetical protein
MEDGEQPEVDINSLSLFQNREEASSFPSPLVPHIPPSLLAVLDADEDDHERLALFDSILAAPLQVKKSKTEIPVYSE